MSESVTPTQQDPERLRISSHAREKYRSEVLSPTDWPIEDALAHGNALPASARELWATRRHPAPDDVIWSSTARVALLVRNDRVQTVTHARQLDEEQRQAVAQVDDSVKRGDGPVTDGGKVCELFGLIAQLAEETAEEVDDDDGIDGVWERSVPARAREFDDWLIAVNFDADTARDYRPTEDLPPITLVPDRARVWPRDGEGMTAAVISPAGGRVRGLPDDDLEGELIRDVRAELKRVRSGEIVTDGGTDRLPVDCPADGCEARIESRGDALVHILAHAGVVVAGVEIVADGGIEVPKQRTLSNFDDGGGVT